VLLGTLANNDMLDRKVKLSPKTEDWLQSRSSAQSNQRLAAMEHSSRRLQEDFLVMLSSHANSTRARTHVFVKLDITHSPWDQTENAGLFMGVHVHAYMAMIRAKSNISRVGEQAPDAPYPFHTAKARYIAWFCLASLKLTVNKHVNVYSPIA